MIVFKNAQNTELHKEDQKNRLQSDNPNHSACLSTLPLCPYVQIHLLMHRVRTALCSGLIQTLDIIS